MAKKYRENNIVQLNPKAINALSMFRIWAKEPDIKLPKGVVPAKIIVYKLITLPRYSSEEESCRDELAVVVKRIAENPANMNKIDEKW